MIDVAFIPVAEGAATDMRVMADLSPTEHDTGVWVYLLTETRAATARMVARRELGRRLGIHPRQVALITSLASGKPYDDCSNIGVSWSHSGNWVALAVADRGTGRRGH